MSYQCRLHPLTAVGRYWCDALDGDPVGRALYRRHYSARRYRDGRESHLFVGPGEKMVLVAPSGDALFVWRRFRSADDQEGVNCAVFRNEGSLRSSEMIEEAADLAWRRWPRERLYTYVNPQKDRERQPRLLLLEGGLAALRAADPGRPARAGVAADGGDQGMTEWEEDGYDSLEEPVPCEGCGATVELQGTRTCWSCGELFCPDCLSAGVCIRCDDLDATSSEAA